MSADGRAISKGSEVVILTLMVLLALLTSDMAAHEFMLEEESVLETAQNGTSARLYCPFDEDVEGHLLVWFFNRTIISTNRMSYLESVRPFKTPGGVQGLEIGEVSARHEGPYYCQVPGAFTKFFNLVVTYPPQITLYSPNLSKVLTREGSSYSMECQASGKPEPVITWTKKDPPHRYINLLTNSTILRLSNLSRSDRGSYTCEASNGVGSPARHTFNIHIAYPPVILHTSEDVHVGIGLNVSIQCVVNSNPAPQVTWHKVEDHNTLLDHVITHEGELDGGHTVSSRLSFWRVQRSDEGEYICRGQNDLDVTERRVRLKGSPHDLVVTSRMMGEHSHSYHLSWQVVSLSKLEKLEISLEPILNFGSPRMAQELDAVEYPVVLDGVSGGQTGVRYVPANNRTIRDSVLGPRNSYVIEDLFPDTEYELRMRVANAFGFSSWTKGFRFRTAEVVQNDENLESSSSSMHLLLPTVEKRYEVGRQVFDASSSGTSTTYRQVFEIIQLLLLLGMSVF